MSVDTPAWVRDAVFYQIFPDRFASSERVAKPGPLEPWDSPPTTHGFKGGDLIGIAERLDHIADLGATALYLTPIFSSASNHRYHTYDYLTVDPLLGGDAGLRTLLDAAHARGMRVVLDGVFNHAGRGFWPFHHVMENGADSPYRNWFHLDPSVLDGSRPIRAYPEPGTPPATSGTRRGGTCRRSRSSTPTSHSSASTCSGSPSTGSDSASTAGGWTSRPRSTTRRSGRSSGPVAGRSGPTPTWSGRSGTSRPEWLRGDRFDALMNYPLTEAILGFAGGPSLDMDIVRGHHEYRRTMAPLDGPGFAARLLETADAYDPDVVAVQLNLLSSHDAPRMRTVLGGDDVAVRLAVLIQMTLPGAPCVYYGDEVGLAGGNDPACRGAFPWDTARWDVALRDFIRDAIRLRSGEPALRHGALTVLAADGDTVVYERRLDDRAVLVAVNAGGPGRRRSVSGRATPAPAAAVDRFAVGGARWTVDPDGSVELALDGRSGRVLELVPS